MPTNLEEGRWFNGLTKTLAIVFGALSVPFLLSYWLNWSPTLTYLLSVLLLGTLATMIVLFALMVLWMIAEAISGIFVGVRQVFRQNSKL